MERMTEEKLLSIVKAEFRDAMGAEGQQISLERARSLDAYLNKPLGNEEDEESEATTSDVADVVDGIMPSLLRIFTTADNVCSFKPVGAEDIAAAEQESDYVNHVFFQEQDDPSAFMIMYSWFFDAMVQKNGIVEARWDESEEVTQESYENLAPTEYAELLEDPELEPIEREDTTDENGFPVLDEMGEPHQNITFRRIRKEGRVKVENIPPNEYRVSSDANSIGTKQPRMVGRERLVPRSDLIDMGFDKKLVETLPAVGETFSTEELSRNDKTDDHNGDPLDKSQELIQLRKCYLKVDYDGDGRSELREIFTGGGKLLRWSDGTEANEVVDRRPLHVLCPRPIPHRHFGLSVAELVEDIREISSTLLRQVLNNLYRTNTPRHGISEYGLSENTLDDLLAQRPGGVVRFARNPNEVYSPLTVPFTAGHTFPMMEYFEKVKRDRTGISSDGEGLSPEALKNIQTTVLAQAVDLSKMKIEAIARIFAETGIRSLFLHIHELLLKHQKKEKIVELRNGFVPVKPSEWRTRTNMKVEIGLGLGTREQNLMHLEAIKELQRTFAEGGLGNIVVTPKNAYNVAKEFVKNARMQNPDLYFTDPGDQLAPPPSDEQQELQKMQAELEQRQQMLDQWKRQIDSQKLEIDQQKMAIDHREEMMKLEEKREEREDKFMVENEKLRNQLVEMQRKAETDQEELRMKQAKLKAEIQNIVADTLQKRASAAKAMEEARAQGVESDAVESGITRLLSNGQTEESA